MEATAYWQWTGLFPYAKINGRYKLSAKYLTLSIFSILTSTATTFYYHLSQNFRFLPLVSYLNLIIAKLLALFLPIYSFYLMCFVPSRIIRILESLEKVDKTLKRIGLEVERSSFRGRYAFHVTYSFVAATTDLVFFYRQFFRTLPYFVSRLFWTSNVLQLLDFIDIFRIYFTRLNNNIARGCTLKQLEVLIHWHHLICCSLQSFNRVYSFSLLLIISHIFLYIANILNYIFHLLERYGFSKIKVEIIHLFPMLSIIIILLQIISLCVKANRAAEEFTKLLYQLMLNDKTREISGNNTLLLHISMKREVSFTAFGFFKIDYTLLHSMIAAATTYFVILVQFGQPAFVKSTAMPEIIPTNITDLPTYVTTLE